MLDTVDVLPENLLTLKQQLINSELALKAFEANVSEKGWLVRDDTPQDGNCFFGQCLINSTEQAMIV